MYEDSFAEQLQRKQALFGRVLIVITFFKNQYLSLLLELKLFSCFVQPSLNGAINGREQV